MRGSVCVYTYSFCCTYDNYILIWIFFPHLMTVLHQVQLFTGQKTHHYYLTALKEKNILPLKYDRPLFERHILISEMLKYKRKKRHLSYTKTYDLHLGVFLHPISKKLNYFHESLKNIPFYQCTLAYLATSFWWWFISVQFFDVTKMLQWIP